MAQPEPLTRSFAEREQHNFINSIPGSPHEGSFPARSCPLRPWAFPDSLSDKVISGAQYDSAAVDFTGF
jgi:hypothetical protein